MAIAMIAALTVNGQSIDPEDVNPGFSLSNVVKISTTEVSAIDYYTRIIDRNPSNVKYLMLRSDMYRSAGMEKEAINDLQRAVSINPYAEIYTSRAMRKNLFPVKKYDYSTLVNSNNEDPFFKSFVLMDQYKKKLETENILDKYELKSIISLIDKGEYTEAKYLLDELDTSYYHNELYYDLIGVLEMKSEDYENAILHFDMAIELDPNFVIPYHNRAVAYKKLGDYEKAENDFTNALTLNDNIAKIYFSKANLMSKKGDKESAKYYYNQALQRADYYPQAVSNYAVLLKSIGDYTDALVEMDRAIHKNPSQTTHYYVRAGIHFTHGNYNNAIDDFEKYLEYHTEDKEAMFFMGLSKLLLEEPANGCYDMEKSMDLGYDDETSNIYWFMCD